MSVTEITPYLTVFAPVAGLIVIMDYVIRDEIKDKIRDQVIHLAQVGTRPRSLAFYGLVVLLSLLFSILIVSINGTLETIKEHENSMSPAIKSAGPLLIAVFLKILIWDYLMAYKSFLFWNSLRSSGRKNWMAIIAKSFVVICDLYVTAILTAGFLNWFDLTHMKNLNAATSPPIKSLVEFFNSMNLALEESIQKSFYVLNGSLIFYLAAAVCWLTRGALPVIDTERMKEHIFKIIAALVSVVLLIVLVSYRLASH